MKKLLLAVMVGILFQNMHASDSAEGSSVSVWFPLIDSLGNNCGRKMTAIREISVKRGSIKKCGEVFVMEHPTDSRFSLRVCQQSDGSFVAQEAAVSDGYIVGGGVLEFGEDVIVLYQRREQSRESVFSGVFLQWYYTSELGNDELLEVPVSTVRTPFDASAFLP